MGGDGFDGLRTREQPKVHHGASWPLVFLSQGTQHYQGMRTFLKLQLTAPHVGTVEHCSLSKLAAWSCPYEHGVPL